MIVSDMEDSEDDSSVENTADTHQVKLSSIDTHLFNMSLDSTGGNGGANPDNSQSMWCGFEVRFGLADYTT